MSVAQTASPTVARTERPRQPRRAKGKGWAFLFALAVQVGFLAVLVFSVQWQNRKPEAVTAELYAPPVKAPVVVEQPPPPAPQPQPAPPPPPPPVVEKPDTRAADIALKAKQEEERKVREENERRAREAKDLEDKRKLEEKQKAERQQKEMAAMQIQAEREIQARQAQQAAEATARSRSEADWIRRIQAKVKGNVIVPSELSGNPEAVFEVVQLPTGEIIEATLVKSSGNRAYDDAVQRAIIKSSPLPRPDRSELFQRALTLKFRPQD